MRILLVDDYEADVELAKRYLRADRKTSYQVEHCETLDKALARGRMGEFDVALLDLSLPDSHGLTTFQAFHEALPELATVVVTGLHDEDIALQAVEGGAQDYLVKDELGKGVLVRTLRHAVARKALERKLLAAEQRLKYTTQEALLESEHRYRALFENSADGVAHTATDGRIFEMNPAFLKMVGYSAQEVAAGEVDRNDVLDESDPRLVAALETRKRTGLFRGELNFRHRDGTVFPVELSTSVYLDADGNERSSMIARDMSEARRIERQLHEHREQLAKTEQMSLVMRVHTSPEGYWMKVPPRLCELLGYSEAELLGMTYHELTHPDDLSDDEELTRALLGGSRDSIELEKRFKCKDGSSMWAYLNVTLVRDRMGTPLHFLTYIRDITAEKAAEEHALRYYALLLERVTGLAESVGLAKTHDDVYRALFEFAQVSTPASELLVSNVDHDMRVRRCVFHCWTADGQYQQGVREHLPVLPLEDSAASTAAKERRAVIRDESSGEWQSKLSEPDTGGDSPRPRSTLAIPMLVLGEVLGVFEFRSNVDSAFKGEHLSQLQMAANLAAIASANLRLLQTQSTARKQAEAGRARLQSVIEQAPALMATNEGPDLVFTSVNEKYRSFFHEKEILGRRLADVLPEVERQGILDILQRVRTTGESYSCAELPIELDALGNGDLQVYYFNLVYQALRDHEGNITGVLANSVDITEQVRARKEAEELHAHLRNAYESTIEGWARALDLKDEETAGHSQRVTRMTVELARRLGVANEDLVDIRRGALLHDIGKMGVPDRILLKPGSLDAAEWNLMKRHTAYARDLLYPIEHLRPASDIPYCHHEKWDGSGYPNGLSGEEIPLAARIFAIVDVFDALTSDRPYRPAWSRDEALAYIADQSGKHFDPEVVTEFLCLCASGGHESAEQRPATGQAEADPASGNVK